MDDRGETSSELYATGIERAAELYSKTAEARQGRIVFVAGSAGSGRTAFLRELAAAHNREKPRPLIVGGSLASGSYAPWPGSERPAAMRRFVETVESVLALTAPIAPVAALAGQVASMSKAARRLLRELHTPGTRAPDDLLPVLLRAAAEEHPVVVLVDDAHGGGSLWFDLVSTFSSQVVSQLPLSLFLALEGPTRLPSSAAEEAEPDSLVVARELCRRGLAEWWALRPLTRDDVAAWIRPRASDVVVDAIHSVTGGLRSWTDALWRDWVDRGVVQQGGEDGRWQFALDYRERATNPVSEILSGRLRSLSGATKPQELFPLYDLLTFGALEGRIFTAEAVARALDRDRDETIDLLDVLGGSDEVQPPSILKDERVVTISDVAGGERHLWLYEFSSWLDWLTLERHGPGLLRVSRAHAAGRLAKALEETYGSESRRKAGTLARLLRIAGDQSAARHYQRMADYATGTATLRWQAQQILAADRTDWSRLQRRRKAYLLLEAAKALRRSGPFDEGVQVARCAAALADTGDIGGTPVAEALLCEGDCHVILGDHTSAGEAFHAAMKIWTRVRNERGEAAVRRSLAWMDIARGNYQQARDELIKVLLLSRRLNDMAGVAETRALLAQIEVEQGDYQQARQDFTEVLKLTRGLGERAGAIRALAGLADIDFRQGSPQLAREALTEALKVARELGDRRGETEIRFTLVRIQISEGDYRRAQAELNELLAFASDGGDPRGQAAASSLLAAIDLPQGDYDRGQQRLAAALEVTRRLQDPNETRVRALLGRFELEQGHYGQARRDLNRAREMTEALRQRDVEAAIRIDLARIDIKEGNYARAREELTEVIETLQRLGERHEEAVARRYLARIDIEERNYARARRELTEVVETHRTLGERLPEASARLDLARIDAAEGNTAHACDELTELIDVLQALGTRPDEEKARRELAKLECRQQAQAESHARNQTTVEARDRWP
jgi:tetratricopeptide (TPR) repeat protein